MGANVLFAGCHKLDTKEHFIQGNFAMLENRSDSNGKDSLKNYAAAMEFRFNLLEEKAGS